MWNNITKKWQMYKLCTSVAQVTQPSYSILHMRQYIHIFNTALLVSKRSSWQGFYEALFLQIGLHQRDFDEIKSFQMPHLKPQIYTSDPFPPFLRVHRDNPSFCYN